MSTGISWTDDTWNPVVGCTRVSKGCDNCYAAKMTKRLEGMGQEKYAGLINPGKDHFNGVARLVPEALDIPLRWKRGRRIFVNSMSDLFHEELTFEEIAAIFGVMAACPQHTFQILTKRAGRMREWFAEHLSTGYDGHWPLPNVWLGVSAEDQGAANERIPDLLASPAAVRFVSYEPALGPVDFTRIRHPLDPKGEAGDYYNSLSGNAVWNDGGLGLPNRRLDWVIVGGESGPGARPLNVDWARSVRDECRESGVAFFMKQLGAKPREEGCAEGHVWVGSNPSSLLKVHSRSGADTSEWPEDLRVQEFPGGAE